MAKGNSTYSARNVRVCAGYKALAQMKGGSDD